MSDPAAPVLGWRIWRLRERSLQSLVVDYRWVPGENRASCLASGRPPCPNPPGRHCHCGFWAAWSLRQALTRTCATVEPPWQVMGLVVLSGTVVAHAAEGLRAERATLRCLFTDRPWSWQSPAPGVGGRSDWGALRAVADEYGVPLLSLSNATSLGLTEGGGGPNLLSSGAGRRTTGGA